MANNNDLDKKISPITLSISKGTWELFKSITPRTISLNDAIVQLINEKVCKDKEVQESINKPIKKGRPEMVYEVKKQ